MSKIALYHLWTIPYTKSIRDAPLPNLLQEQLWGGDDLWRHIYTFFIDLFIKYFYSDFEH